MESAIKIASYIYSKYRKEQGSLIDEMKLHKLLYFVQREALVSLGRPAFRESIQAWKYGPVIPVVHKKYEKGKLDEQLAIADFGELMPIIDGVYDHYADKDSWTLSMISHEEYSWKQARIGVAPDKNSGNVLKLEDIALDAERIRRRRELLKSYLSN